MKPSPCLCCLQTLIVAVKETRPSLPLPGSAWVGHSHHLDLHRTTHSHLLSLITNSQSVRDLLWIFQNNLDLDFKLYAMKSDQR